LSARPRTFALLAVVLGLAVACAALLAVDIYAHARLSRYNALNVWGYRGAVVGRKHPGERRIVVVGGSTVFGLGLSPAEAFPAQLEQQLRAKNLDVSVVNLGVDGENAFAFADTLRDYEYLEYDGVILYEGYNNLFSTYPLALRHESWVFRMTGYWPILPTALSEKIMLWRYHGDLSAAYADRNKTVFRFGGHDVARSLQQQVGRLSGPPQEHEVRRCEAKWSAYCDAMASGIAAARSRRARVLVVTQPYISDPHVDQQDSLRAMLREKFAGDAGVRYANLGRGVVDLDDRSIAYDGMHLTTRGNAAVADALVSQAAELIK
jgi:hypothetical protein